MTFVEGKALRLARGGPLSLGIAVKVGQAAAELLSLVTLAEPYPPLQENVKVEATVRGINPAGRLKNDGFGNGR